MVLGLEADGGGELVGVLDRRDAQGADDDALVGDAEADVARQLVAVEEVLQGRGQLVGLLHLALAEDAGVERADPIAAHAHAAIQLELGGGDAGCLDVEADDAL